MSNAQKAAWNRLTEKLAEAMSLLADGLSDERRAEAYEARSAAYEACYEGFPFASGCHASYREDYRLSAERYAKKASDLREIIRLGL
jgi:hypothetical protein